jgi:hypothetical protein
VLQLYTVDAIIMTNDAAVRQTGLKLEIVTVRDYRSIMVPLLKSLMQVCIGFSGLVCSLNINSYVLVGLCFDVGRISPT